jgi:ABC-type antimicrobial peptide transport system permease subunit
MAAAKLGAKADDVAIGNTISFEGRTWQVAGTFSAAGAAFEAEVWCRLDDLQQAMKRQDLSLVAVTLKPYEDFANLELFCMERLDLELQTMPEVEYYDTLQREYGPIRMLAWLVVYLVSGAGVFVGLNTMYGSVVGRTRELASLQTIGFVRRAILVSLIQEGVVLAAAASLLATAVAVTLINEAAVRFTMGAFALRIDEVAVLIGCGVGLLLGVLGAIPPGIRALKVPVIDALRAT